MGRGFKDSSEMMKHWIQVLLLVPIMIFVCLVAEESCAKYYKYIDKNGHLRFVDEPEKIPEAYRKSSTEYKESGVNLFVHGFESPEQ